MDRAFMTKWQLRCMCLSEWQWIQVLWKDVFPVLQVIIFLRFFTSLTSGKDRIRDSFYMTVVTFRTQACLKRFIHTPWDTLEMQAHCLSVCLSVRHAREMLGNSEHVCWFAFKTACRGLLSQFSQLAVLYKSSKIPRPFSFFLSCLHKCMPIA